MNLKGNIQRMYLLLKMFDEPFTWIGPLPSRITSCGPGHALTSVLCNIPSVISEVRKVKYEALHSEFTCYTEIILHIFIKAL